MNAPAHTEQRVIRVFVSSTFRDMQAERDELVLRVFPQLRRLCEERGVATVPSDNAARVWRADGAGEPVVLRAHLDKKRMLPNTGISVTSAAFSPEGTRVVTESYDNTVRVWRVGWKEVLTYLRSKTSACLTVPQRRQYLAEEPDDAQAAYEACERRYGRLPMN